MMLREPASQRKSPAQAGLLILDDGSVRRLLAEAPAKRKLSRRRPAATRNSPSIPATRGPSPGGSRGYFFAGAALCWLTVAMN